MITFGLIGEGHTDHKVLENILVGYFDDREGDRIDFIYRPEIGDRTYQMPKEQFGGWYQVLEYCGSEEFLDGILEQDVDYYIIQINTDKCPERQYLDENISQLPVEQQVEKVVEKLIEKINKKEESFFDKFQSKIIFAIAVNEIECWLLPIFFEDKNKSRTSNCLRTLNRQLSKKNSNLIINPNKKDSRKYEGLSAAFSKRKILLKLHPHNPSLKIFVQTLKSLFHEFENPHLKP